MATDLILTGKLTIGATDVSNECTEFVIRGTRADIVVPSTLGLPQGHQPGAAKYEITIGYLADDGASTTLFSLLWAALSTATKELTFSGNFRDGANSTSNPNWSGTFVVAGADLGGDVGGLATGSITCPLTAAPVKVVV